MKWRIHPEFLKKGRTAYLSCLTVVFLGLNPVQEYDIKRQLLIIAEKYCFQGYWKNVREILQKPFTPGAFFQYHFEKFPSLHEFFGNDLRTMKVIWRTLKTVDPYQVSKAPVKKPQRKRGYDDKGHLSGDSHGADISVPDRERIDTVNIPVSNHLWLSRVLPDKQQQGTMGENTTSREEVFIDENKTISTSNRNDRREDGKTTTSKRVSSIFNWRNPKDRTEIISSFFYVVIKNKKEKLWFRPQFLFAYIFKIHGKEKEKYYGLTPKFLLENERRLLSMKYPNHKILDDFTIEEIFSMFQK